MKKIWSALGFIGVIAACGVAMAQAVPGAINVTSLTGAEIIALATKGPQSAQVTVANLLQAVGLATLDSYTTNTATASTVLTIGNIDTGAIAETSLGLTGTLSGAANAQLPTAAALIANQKDFGIGSSYKLRIINPAGGFTWTVTTNTGWTLNGAMTIPTATWRDFYVTFPTATTAVLQTVGTGTAP